MFLRFPSTGYWWVHFVCTHDGETYNALPVGGYINYTTDNASYNVVSTENAMAYLGYYVNSNAAVFLDITDTTQCKVSFGHKVRLSSSTCIGLAASNTTFYDFYARRRYLMRPEHIESILVDMRSGQWFSWSDSHNKVYFQLGNSF